MNPISLIMRLTGLGKAASTIGLIVAIIALMGMVKCTYDRSITGNYEDGVQKDLGEAKTEAEGKADSAAAASQAEFEAQQSKDKQEIENAKAENRSPLDALFD